MRILVAGAGPAGLYFSYLLKRKNPRWQVRVVEQNRAGSTFGRHTCVAPALSRPTLAEN